MKYRIFSHSFWPSDKGFGVAGTCATYWFRVFGYGLHFRWVSVGYIPIFSERNGWTKVFKIGRLWVKELRP